MNNENFGCLLFMCFLIALGGQALPFSLCVGYLVLNFIKKWHFEYIDSKKTNEVKP